MSARGKWAVPALVLLAAAAAWGLHARAWDLGGRSPLLNYDSSQYALAARSLAESGRLETTYALPIELARHPRPPWPLAAVQPGPVVIEAAWFALFGTREWLTLVLPAACFAALALLLLTSGLRLAGALGGVAAAMALVLDPEAQHFATGGFTELPFTLGLVAALAAIATGATARRPFLFGLLLGAAGAFRGQMLLFLVPLLIATALSEPRRAARVVVLALAGYAALAAPWWLYKWSAFGSPGHDLTRLMLWDRVDGQSWFTLLHQADEPRLPQGMEAVAGLSAKVARNLPILALALATGVRAALLVALVAGLVALRPPRAVAAAGWAAVAVLAVSVAMAAASIPWTRYLFPARVAAEAAGTWAMLALAARAPASLSPALLRGLAAALVVGWGAVQCARGLGEAREVSLRRGVPSAEAMRGLARELDQVCEPGEPVMSSLGPLLAWHARRPVVHLALSPGDLRPVRRKLDVRHVLLVFRDGSQAWPTWRAIVDAGERAPLEPEWGVAGVHSSTTRDGFKVVWLELGPLEDQLAAR
jgi:4-amino-4-deoxy-L-arabinose transferase-like glycosyltransferase